QQEGDEGYLLRSNIGSNEWMFKLTRSSAQKANLAKTFLINSNTGERKEVATNGKTSALCHFSPGGKSFITAELDHFHCYEISDGKERNLTDGIDTKWKEWEYGYNGGPWQYPAGIVGWLKNDAGVLVKDIYDIWLLDMNGIKPPVNLTN